MYRTEYNIKSSKMFTATLALSLLTILILSNVLTYNTAINIGTQIKSTFHYNVTVKLYKAISNTWQTLLHDGHNILTNIGKDKIELELAGTATTDTALYISLTADATGVNAAWTILPAELAASNLTRALGTYTSTGVGTWNVAYTFTSTGTVTVLTTGLNWAASGDNNLLAAVTFGAAATMVSGDKLAVTWSCSVA